MKHLPILFILFPALLFAQERQQLKGKVIADMVKADGVTIKNLTAGTETVTDNEGNFTIHAALDDILEFSSAIFKTLKKQLNYKDLKEELFVIRVEPSAIVLDEVQLTGLTGNLAIDSKNLNVMLFNSLFDPAAINLNVVPDNPLGNMNFASIIGMAINAVLPSSRSSGKPVYAPVVHKPFSKVLLESYPESFFTDTIKIPKERLGLFLNSCNSDAKRYLLDPKNEAELITYLREKYVQYQRQIEINEN